MQAELERQRQMATKALQSFVRGKLARRIAKKLQEEQESQLKSLVCLSNLRLNIAARVLQRFVRTNCARIWQQKRFERERQFQQQRQVRATLTIQSMWRGL